MSRTRTAASPAELRQATERQLAAAREIGQDFTRWPGLAWDLVDLVKLAQRSAAPAPVVAEMAAARACINGGGDPDGAGRHLAAAIEAMGAHAASNPLEPAA
ncbi:MAG: hypothetical protein JWM27_100 [Gemmatimonadetes bacterium]|nr:hypothetical protein [Gemmatimonadota bacterium]